MRDAAIRIKAFLLLVLPVSAMASSASYQQLIEDLERLRAEHEVAGFALTLRRPSGVQSMAGGVADLDSGRPVTVDTLFRIGSITKTFNALAVMQLVEQGCLDLDTPLLEIAADTPLRNPWADTEPVRVVHLLEHSSGLLDITREEFDHNEPFASLDDALAWRPASRVVQWPPGLHQVYSNANAGLAGLVIERISGQDYPRFITQRLLRPLGMHAASLALDEATRQRLATGYDTDGRTPIPYWQMIFPPLGAINATPREMDALLELFLRRGKVGDKRVLDTDSIARMERTTTTLAARNGLTYGYGLGLDQSLHNGFVWYGHGGDGDGYLSSFGYNRRANAGYFITINAFKQNALNAMRDRVRDYLTEGLTAAPPAHARIELDQLRSHTGTYVAVTRRFPWQSADQMETDRLHVVLEDGALYTRTAKGRRLLIPVDAHLFRREGQSVATIAITRHQDDHYLQADFGNYRRIDQAD